MAANDHLTFHGKEMCKMSEAIHDMDAYIQLTEEVFYEILHSTDVKMQKVQCNFVLILNLLEQSIDLHIIAYARGLPFFL